MSLPTVLGPRSVIDPTSPWRELDAELLDERGLLRVRSAAFYDSVGPESLRAWCFFRGVYALPVRECVEWVRERIDGRAAIEIGAGRGWLGRALGIPMTDNYCMEWPSVRPHYEAAGQPTTPYGPDVERLNALSAVRKYAPRVVVGAWVTQLWPKDVPSQPGAGSMHGVDEQRLIGLVDTYIVIGNLRVHGSKLICKTAHQRFRAPWLRSRASHPEDDVIMVWERRRKT